LNVPEGKHEVRLTLSEYFDWEAEVQTEEKSEIPFSIRLFPTREREK
jgi:hypothetical protein